MAEPFGRGSSRSRSRRIRFQCGGSCTSNKSRLETKRIVKNHQQQLPTINQKCFSLKAGTAKAQQPESGSSKESSSSSIPRSSQFKTCRRRTTTTRRKTRGTRSNSSRTRFTTTKLQSTRLFSFSSPTRPTLLFKVRLRYTSSTTSKETLSFPFIFIFKFWPRINPICEKNGR